MKKIALMIIPILMSSSAYASEKNDHHVLKTIAKAALVETPLEGVILGAQVVHDHYARKNEVEQKHEEPAVVNPPEEKDTSDEKSVDTASNDDDEDDYDYRAGVHKFGLTGP